MGEVGESEVQATGETDAEGAVPFFQLFHFADGVDYWLMFFGTLGAAAHGLALPIFLLVFGKLLNSLGTIKQHPEAVYGEVGKYALYFVYLAIGMFFASWAEVACWMITGERQTVALRIKYLEAMLKQDVGYFDVETRTGDIIDALSSNTVTIQEAISEKMGNFLHFMFTFIGGFVVGFAVVWQLGLVTLAIVPLVAVIGALYTFALTGLTSKGQVAYTTAGIVAEEVIGQIRTVYSFVGESTAACSYASALQSSLKLGHKSSLAKGLGVGSMYGVLLASWSLLVWYGGVLVRNGSANGGSVLSTIFAVLVGSLSLGQASANVGAFAKARSAAYKLMKVVNHVSAINSDCGGIELPQVEGHVQLENVHFSYPSRPDVKIFQGFSLDIPAGKSVAIVGGSGSGKSTVVSLIERFYDPASGQVMLDGHDIRNLQVKWLRSQIGLVNQEPALFACTIQQNILYGRTDATKEQVEDAAKAANAHDFISQLPEGYETQVGEKGVQLSGGQKQRIAIARAMIKGPSVLLLDEATSALDAESERIVQDALDKLMLGRTSVIVAHRLSTIRNASAIAVVEDGKIVQLGSHDELVGEDGAYMTLVHLQETAASNQESSSTKRSFSRKTSLKRSSSFRSSSFQSNTLSEDFELELHLETDKPASSQYFLRLLKLNMREWPFLLLGSAGAILAGTVNPSFAFLISQVLSDYYVPDKKYMKSELAKYSAVLACFGLFVFLLHTTMHYSFGVSGENLTNRVRQMMFGAITRFEVSWFDREQNGSAQLSSALSTNAAYVRAAMGDRITVVVQNSSLVLSAMIISYVVEWRVALVMTATFPFLIFSGIAEQMFLKGFAGNLAKSHERATSITGEAVSNIRTIAAFNAEMKLVELVSTELDGPKKSSILRGNAAGLGYGLGSFFMYTSMGLALWYAGRLLKQGKSDFGDVMKSFFVLFLTSNGIAETIALAPDIAKCGEALKSVFSILDRKTVIEPDDPAAEVVDKVLGEIEFRRVSFHYPSRPEVIIFQDLNLRVHTGQSLAVVGASGSGKSSIIALVERFYDPVAGKVMVDGKNIRKLNLRSYRRHVGLVQQEPALFATTIYDNICYGKEGATEQDVVEAAKAANAHNFISALPDGYQTAVGERGAQLSGGQKQRVAIARAVLKNPSILLLDEATSALDAESESIVQDALERLMRQRTTLVVAHRLSTIRHADQIAVIHEGQIVEKGSHEELESRPDGAYSRLIQLQLRSVDNNP